MVYRNTTFHIQQYYFGIQEYYFGIQQQQQQYLLMSRYISYILRHGAIEKGLKIDAQGYVAMDDLLHHLKHTRKESYDLAIIQDIVAKDEKQRFTLEERDGLWFIRANQGHSIASVTDETVTPILDPAVYPDVIHGTFHKNLESIKTQGLSKMTRNHIHFATSRLASSGIRRDANIFIYVDMATAMLDGIPFFVSTNGVVLTPGNKDGFLEPEYFLRILNTKKQDLLKPSEPKIPCAGCIVFRKHPVLSVCLVGTHSGNLSFPKGKRNSGESLRDAAIRELREETGLTTQHLEPIREDCFIDELSNRGNVAIRLYVTDLVDGVNPKLEPEDKEEIATCDFIPIDQALKMIVDKRQTVLNAALAKRGA